MRCDLHLHTTASDGALTPQELVHRAEAAGLNAFAITDHDTFAGTAAVTPPAGVRLIRGAELSLRDMRGLHLLVYGSLKATELHRTVRRLADKRVTRGERMLDALAERGIALDRERVRAAAGETSFRPHIAREMVRAGFAGTEKEAFDRWIGDGRPCFVPSDKLTMREALSLAARSGFVPVLAHPCELKLPPEKLEALLDSWQKAGLRGMEIWHPSGAAMGYDALERIARRRGLLVTGGSDFHRPGDGRHGEIGCMAGRWQTADTDLEALESAMREAAAGAAS